MSQSLLTNSSDSHLYPSIEHSYLLAEKIIAGSSCVLSILGAILVIFSFLYDSETSLSWKEVFCKICCGYRITERKDGEEELRTKYKFKSYHYILINLSIADIIVAASHLWGLCSNLEEALAPNITVALSKNESIIASGTSISCTTQGAYTALSTMASFFWTDILAVFLAFNMGFIGCSNNFIIGKRRLANVQELEEGIVVPEKKDAPNCCESPFFLYILFPFIGWGVPMLMTVGFAVHGMLGYIEAYDGGWCYFYLDPNSPHNHNSQAIIFGYSMWLWASMGIVLISTIIYAVMACVHRRKDKNFTTNCTEFRYLSVGIAFSVLRIPSTLINFYLQRNPENYKTVAAAVINIAASATISLQGGVNGIIYLCCRNSVWRKCCARARRPQHEEYEHLLDDARMNTAAL